MRVILNAPAVRALIETDQEAFAELAKNATAQVAESLKNKLLSVNIDDTIKAHLENYLRAPNWWSTKQLNPTVVALLAKAFANASKELLNDAFANEVCKEITGKIDKQMKEAEQKMLADLGPKIDALLRERFAAMFNKS